jgi:hypothetical protein
MTWSTNAESDTVMTMFPIANILFVPAWGTKVNTKVETSFGGKSETDNIALELNRRDTPCGKEGEDTVTLTVAFDCEVGVNNNADAMKLKNIWGMMSPVVGSGPVVNVPASGEGDCHPPTQSRVEALQRKGV